MSYLRYLCLFVYSGIKHILCCVFVWFFFVLCILCYQFLLYSLTFIMEHLKQMLALVSITFKCSIKHHITLNEVLQLYTIANV